ncbi:MAG: DUF5655 domain-containing protein [Candidatus Eremiobacteraeota bacterium]|nr:DUF5655 domain-containing protein [Candidatus Eremiobacteraeota bacterium]
MKDKSIVGDLINFRGLVYSPLNENGVVFLFGKVVEDLNMYVEEIKPGFPDCIGRRYVGKGWERVAIEFEYKSRNFKNHGHNPAKCNIIVCWEHNWKECPIEVIELKEVIKDLPNISVKKPIKEIDNLDIEGMIQLKGSSDAVKKLFHKLNDEIKKINDKIWIKVSKSAITFYCPERVFIYASFQKESIKLQLFTGRIQIENVTNYPPLKSWDKYGYIFIKDENDIQKAVEAAKKSFKIIKNTIKKNEPTNWHIKYNNGDQEEDDIVEIE